MFNGYGDQVADLYQGWILPATINEDASSLTPGRPTWNPAIRVLVFLICLVPFLLLVNAVAKKNGTRSCGAPDACHG